MALSEDDLLDFNTNRLPDWDGERVLQLLTDQPELFRNHLAIARHLEQRAQQVAPPPPGVSTMTPQQSYNHALLDVAAHLRQGLYTHGGNLYEQTMNADA
jgi:hypothetical protein